VETAARREHQLKSPGIFYGWYIVGVGFLANVASSFALASTLSIFLKPLTAELGISRGVFSLLRSGEGIIGACLAPVVGTLVDRYGGRWLMVLGAAITGLGFLLLGTVDSFGQFAAIRLTLVTFGDALMGYMVVNVVVAQWFIRQRGRAFAFTSMGVGFAKVCMPVLAAWLLVSFGWRQTWMVFGVLTMALLVLPALLVVRRTPEDMGLRPDGAAEPVANDGASARGQRTTNQQSANGTEPLWTRAEAVRTTAFWLIVITIGISSVVVTGLNLNV
jgi:MFS family permease